MSTETTVRKAYKYKLKPTRSQERAFERTLMLCRHLYNAALEERQTAWHRCGVSLTYYDQAMELPDLKVALPEYADVHSQVLQDILRRVDRAYHAFFRRVKEAKKGEKPGYPRFQGRNRYHNFTYPQFGNGARLENGFVVLSKIGRVPVRWSRPMEGTPKTVTISNEADGWYVVISCADVPVQSLPVTGHETGIDLGLESFATLADGQRIHASNYFREAEAYLRRCQRRLARRAKGSHRRRKAVVLLAKAYQHVANQRRDYQHKAALNLLRANDTVYHEDLNVANMVKNHHLAKSISDAGWAQFIAILTSKAACAGRKVVAVDPAYTSQACSGCGVIVTKGLSVRWHECPGCGTSLHRDHNAALNILRRGQELRRAG